MEEDIKKLFDLAEAYKFKADNTIPTIYGDSRDELYGINKSIMNILNELERLQKEFEAVDHECSRLEKKEIELENKKCLHCGNDTPLYCEKCQQELISKNAELQLENEELKFVVKSIDKVVMSGMPDEFTFVLMRKENFLKNFENTYIDKQVIRDKIEELIEKINKLNNKKLWNEPFDTNNHYKFNMQIDILKELLGE